MLILTGSTGSPYADSHQHLDHHHDSDAALRKMRTAGSISISPELFEKLYLTPQHKVSGDLRRTFGNPTPLYARLLSIPRDEANC